MENELNNKILNGLERISEAYKSLLWEKAKLYGISPIQIQILLFVSNHDAALCNVSNLAKEFNITKPTVSDAVRVLNKKELIVKDYSSADNRSYTLGLSEAGRKLALDLTTYDLPIRSILEGVEEEKLQSLYSTLSELIYKLNRSGILTIQRTCFACRFYEKREGTHYCQYLDQQLLDSEIRLDCAEFEKMGEE